MNIKTLIGISAVAFALIAGVNYAFSEENPQGSVPADGVTQCLQFTEAQAELEKNGVAVTKLSQMTVDSIIKMKGNPPNTPDGFALYRDGKDGKGQLVAVDTKGCVTFATPIMPDTAIDNFLGVVNG